MRKRVDIDAALLTVTGEQLRSVLEMGLTRGYDTEMWGFREHERPEWRTHFRQVASSETLGRSEGSFADVLADGVESFELYCTLPTVTGLPADSAGWDEAAKLVSDVFATGLREHVSARMVALLPESRHRRFFPWQKADVTDDQTLYGITLEESGATARDTWLTASGPDLLDVLRAAHSDLERMLSDLAAEDRRLEEQRQATERAFAARKAAREQV